MHALTQRNPINAIQSSKCPTVYGNAFAVAVARYDTINAANPRRCT